MIGASSRQEAPMRHWCAALAFAALPALAGAGEKMKPEEVVARHLDALGAWSPGRPRAAWRGPAP